MAGLKESITVRVGGADVLNYDATIDFTTDIIPWDDLKGFSLDIWFNVLNGASPVPKVTIQVSNDTNVNSFVTYVNAIDVELPELFTKTTVRPNYIRFIYDSTGVDAGSLISINLFKITL